MKTAPHLKNPRLRQRKKEERMKEKKGMKERTKNRKEKTNMKDNQTDTSFGFRISKMGNGVPTYYWRFLPDIFSPGCLWVRRHTCTTPGSTVPPSRATPPRVQGFLPPRSERLIGVQYRQPFRKLKHEPKGKVNNLIINLIFCLLILSPSAIKVHLQSIFLNYFKSWIFVQLGRSWNTFMN